jgi:hypothetical protein
MQWLCAECDTELVVVCHHCGKALCRRHRFLVDDDAFHHKAEIPVYAAHCRDCRSTFHSWVAPLTGRRNR